MEIKFLMASERAKHSASVVERAILVWSFDFQITGHPAYMKVTPMRNSDALGSFDVDRVHAPAKSAPTYSYYPLSKFGFMMVHFSLVLHRHFIIFRIAYPCACLELLEYFAH